MTANLLPVLKQIKTRPPRLDEGICGNLQILLGEIPFCKATTDLRDLMEKWPETSGDRIFPVEGKIDMFLVDSYHNKLWDNPRRIALLDWLIKELENG